MSRPRQRTFTDEDKRAALKLTAQIGFRPAARELKVNTTQLQNWRRAFPEYWSELVKGEDEEKATQEFAKRVDELAQQYADIEVEGLDRAAELLPGADAKETAALLKALSQGRTTAVNTSARLRGEPDERRELTINFAQVEQAMHALLDGAPLPAIEGTAEDA